MHIFDTVSEDNFVMYASRMYNNPQCTTVDEFCDDLNRFKYLNRLFKRYTDNNDDLQERLILNHLIIIYNVFGIEGGHKLTFFKIKRDYWEALKTFLIYLNYLTDDALVTYQVDNSIVTKLRTI
jgi:hypothetical protein|tara:strand:+ start:9294 stop:9665 length:372 start_codon:yes stop_codon:yes gene_type:complete